MPDFDLKVDAYYFSNTEFTKNYKSWSYASFQKSLERQGIGASVDSLFLCPILYILLTNTGIGHCYGMSSSDVVFYEKPELKPTANVVHLIKMDQAAPLIKAYQIEQNTFFMHWLIKFSEEEWDHKDPINELINSIKMENKPMTLLFGGVNDDKSITLRKHIEVPLGLTEGGQKKGLVHAVVAYKVYIEGEKYRVVIYDVNDPNAIPVATFNFSEPVNSQFNYPPAETIISLPSEDWYVIADIVHPHDIVTVNKIEKSTIEKFKTIVNNWLFLAASKIITVNCPVNVSITDQYGRSINDEGISEIPNAEVFVGEDVKIFVVPDNLTYSVDVDAYDSGNFTLTQSRPLTNESASIISFTNVSITSNTEATVTIEPTVVHKLKIDDDGDGDIDREKNPDVNKIIGQTTYSIPLHTGWNLISIPLVPEDSNINSVFSSIAGNYSVVWTTTSTGGWKSSNQAFGKLTDITVDKGYLIYMTAPDTLVIEGTEPASTTINLTSGWNLVGYPSQTTRSITDVLSVVSYDVVWTTTSTGGWKSSDQAFGRLTDMSPGNGYMIYAPVSGSYTVD